MTIEYIRYTLKSHAPEELIAAYREAAQHLEAAPECTGFELAQCDDEPESFVLRIQWTSRAAHLDGFRKGPHFPPFLAKIRSFIPEITEMRHYSPTRMVGGAFASG